MVTRIGLLVVSDRGMHQAALSSFRVFAQAVEVAELIHVDDSEHKLGFCGAVREGWERIRASRHHYDYVFHLEEDWLFRCVVNVEGMCRLLDRNRALAQVALRRAPINDREIAAGGVVEQWEHTVHRDPDWIEHSTSFTTNPCVYPRDLVRTMEWPEAPECEGRFGYKLAMAGWRFAYWGPPGKAGVMVDHVGARAGGGY